MNLSRSIFALGVLCLFAAGAAGEPPELEPGVKIEADGAPIAVEIGHLVPVVADWNGDGKKDLIVGQFSGGKIRLYTNVGTDDRPVFGKFEYLRAGGKEISLPAG